jgi:hypothetical protein
MTTSRDTAVRAAAPVDDERRGALFAQALSRAPEPPADLAARALAAAFSAPPVPRAVDAFVAVAARFFVGAAAAAAVAVVVLVRSSSVATAPANEAVVEDVASSTTDEPSWHAWRASSNYAGLTSLDAGAAP